MTYLEKAQELYKMIGEGKLLDIFDDYYADDIVMIESSGKKYEGKEANLKREKDFAASVKEIHGIGYKAVTSNEAEAVTMVETWMDVTFNDDRRLIRDEVAVQRWKEGRIVDERFYYNSQS